MGQITMEMLLDWYRQMVLIREFEEACQHLYEQKRITGVYLHLYSGHEAIAVGAIANMVIGKDHIITAYRDHGIALAIGCDPGATMAEMMGKRDGLSGGKGGSMHLASRRHNFWGGYAIVGGHLPLATGLALESQYNERGAVVISMVGDGATNNGYFHEALNMSGVWRLPNIWIIENNGYGMGTEVERASANPILHERAKGYGTHDLGRIDGQDVVAVYEAVCAAKEYALAYGPVLIEAMTYRYRGHGVSDKQYNTRLAQELEEWKQTKDPITILARRILAQDPQAQPKLDQITGEQHKVVEEAIAFADNSPLPDTLEELYAHIYVD
ncbi:MAG: thiamine pyrophosphate-dependent enzyme [Anaerolineae bacterium]|nr:thiamine pyrophosphate-dependent enzyme [Anaerolineae bacterium]MDW8171848.1 thiamine pyrophosphate-dependent enzyme [Anaerolineae bacterium]